MAVVADGRFAPSPSGPLHLGNLRTALLAWLFARSEGSRFLVRMEDLDRGSTRPHFVTDQLDDLAALGLDWDGPVVRQSERLDLFLAAIEQLRSAGLTYPCFCSRREIREAARAPHQAPPGGRSPAGAYPGTCRDLTARQRQVGQVGGRPPALRLRAGETRVRIDDRLRGPIEGVVDDFVLMRGDGTPAYNLAVVVDDGAQRIGEVVRGDDLLSSTPRQVHLAAVLDIEPPDYAHVPLVLGRDGARLAKRHGAVTLAHRAAAGEGVPVVLSRLGISLGLAQPGEAVTPALLLRRFDPDRLPQHPWVPEFLDAAPAPR
ncbi:MAG: tRNA glutamyl-Q(34) synthetase GluQRS [Acidimicrobiales bacterium]